MLAKLVTVDGTGSGLDADLLDGLISTAFVLEAPIDGKQYARKDLAWAEVIAAASGSILNYMFNTATAAPPASAGCVSTMRRSLAPPSLSELHHQRHRRRQYQELLYPADKSRRHVLFSGSSDDPTKWQLFRLNAAYTDNGTYVTMPVTWLSGGSALTAARIIASREGATVANPVGEAPIDGQEYNRKNASWVVDAGGGGGSGLPIDGSVAMTGPLKVDNGYVQVKWPSNYPGLFLDYGAGFGAYWGVTKALANRYQLYADDTGLYFKRFIDAGTSFNALSIVRATGLIEIEAAPTTTLGIATKGYVDGLLASPTFTGDPKAPTVAKTDNDTSIATTAHVKLVVADYAPLAAPTFTGDAKAVTPTAGDNDTSIATTAFVDTSFAKKASPTFTGKVTTPTPVAGSAGLILPPGVAPTSPADGDMWVTSAGLFVRVAGVTVGPLSAGGAGVNLATYTCAIANSGTQSIPINTVTKVTMLGNIDTDPSGFWDNTNKRIRPTRAGLYFCTGKVTFVEVQDGRRMVIWLRKNAAGTSYMIARGVSGGSGQAMGFFGGAYISFNGTTDFIEMDTYQASDAAKDLDTSAGYTGMTAQLVG